VLELVVAEARVLEAVWALEPRELGLQGLRELGQVLGLQEQAFRAV
jgi:hypothetical protein